MNVRGRNGTIIPGFRVFLYLNTEQVLCGQMHFNDLQCVPITMAHIAIFTVFYNSDTLAY